jgi:hypothetical protein
MPHIDYMRAGFRYCSECRIPFGEPYHRPTNFNETRCPHCVRQGRIEMANRWRRSEVVEELEMSIKLVKKLLDENPTTDIEKAALDARWVALKEALHLLKAKSKS